MKPSGLRWRVSLVAAAVFLVSSCNSTNQVVAAEGDELVAQGRDIALTNCSACHAIDDERISPRADAPPLLSILTRYESEQLANDLIEGVRVGHDDMPHFDFAVREADALIAYLKSIEHTPRAAEH